MYLGAFMIIYSFSRQQVAETLAASSQVSEEAAQRKCDGVCQLSV
jgi:hypothetical protein